MYTERERERRTERDSKTISSKYEPHNDLIQHTRSSNIAYETVLIPEPSHPLSTLYRSNLLNNIMSNDFSCSRTEYCVSEHMYTYIIYVYIPSARPKARFGLAIII